MKNSVLMQCVNRHAMHVSRFCGTQRSLLLLLLLLQQKLLLLLSLVLAHCQKHLMVRFGAGQRAKWLYLCPCCLHYAGVS